MMSRIATLCNESYINYSSDQSGGHHFTKTGESTEAALKVLAEKCGLPDAQATAVAFANKDGKTRCRVVHDYWNKTCQSPTNDDVSLALLTAALQMRRSLSWSLIVIENQ